MHMCDPPRIYPSLPDYTLFFNSYMRPPQNLPLPPKIYPPFQELYATLPESTPPAQNIPLFHNYNIMRLSQQRYATLPKSTPPSYNIPSFQQMHMCDPPRIYPSLPKYTPLFNNYMRRSQNLLLPPRIYPFFTTIIICDPLRIYPCLPESTPPLFKNYKILRPSQNLPLTPRIFFSSGSSGTFSHSYM